MKKKFISKLCATALVAALVGDCLPAAVVQAGANMEKAEKVVTISPENASPFNNGEFQGWGTSFCWWANRLGYSDSLAQKAADAFYSKDQGLGMNIIRYNIGGGDDPAHNHITRTDSEVPGYWKEGTEKYENGEYTWEYDWTKDANQRNVLLKCVEEYGDGIIVEAFSNSPPYFMTNSGCATGAVDPNKNNLKDDAYEAFAKYMADVAAHFRDVWEVEFQSITPMNEPYTDYWGAYSWKQEGCHFDQGKSQSTIIEELKKAMDANGFTDIIYSGTDETSIDTQIASYNALSEEAKEIITRIDSHTYGGSKYSQLKQTARDGGENLWMSEVDGGNTEGTESGEMGSALYFANKIIKDMNGLTPSAWIMWQVIDNHICEEGYNGKEDYGMPNTKGGFWGAAVADHDNDTIVLTKKYYALGQFTRYIRPGYTIIAGTGNSLAALDKENNKLVIVATNTEAENVTYDFDLSLFGTVGQNVEVIRTSGDMESGENWAELDPLTTYGKGFLAELKANSVTTFIVEGVTIGDNEDSFTKIAVDNNMITGSNSWNNDANTNYEKVIDGDIDTFFDGLTEGYVKFDLGEMYDLDAIAYAPRAKYEYRCMGAMFQGSIDGDNWFNIYTIEDKPGTQLTRVVKKAFENDYAVRYVRYTVPAGKSPYSKNGEEDYNCNIAEIELYGTKASLDRALTLLEDKLSYYKSIEQGYYTETSYGVLTKAISDAEGSEKSDLVTVYKLIRALDSAYATLEIGGTVPVEIVDKLPVIVIEAGEMPQLPETVQTKTKDGITANSPVEWKTEYDYTKEYATLWVQGTVIGTDLTIEQQVEVIPDASKLVYYIDCGTEETGSDIFDLVKEMAPALKNQVADQTYNSAQNTWGVGGVFKLKEDDNYTSATEKKLTGYYGENSSTEPISYTLPLEAGNYKITMQAYEWWTGPRSMDFEVIINEGGQTRIPALEKGVMVLSTSRNAQASGLISLKEDTVVTVTVKATTNQAPVLSFLAVETTTEEVPEVVDNRYASIYGSVSAGAVVAGELPVLQKTVQVKTKDNRIVDADVTWNSYDADNFKTPYSRVVVEGKVVCPVTRKEFKVSTFVEVVPKDLVYFIDCGMADSGSQAYNAVKELVSGLGNQVCDQAFTNSTTWGYKGNAGTYTANDDGGSATEKFFAGHYGANKSSTPVTYTLPLEAGIYDFSMYVHNWWSTRSMTVTAEFVPNSGATETYTIKENYRTEKHAADKYETIETTLNFESDGVLTLKFTADSNQDGAIINFIGVAKSEKGLDRIDSITGTVGLQAITVDGTPSLPATLEVRTVGGSTKEAAVTWNDSTLDFSVPYSYVDVTGTVEGTELTTTATVLVVPEDLVYFIDAGTAEIDSASYDAVVEMGADLSNEVADKTFNESDWGISGGTVKGNVAYGARIQESGYYDCDPLKVFLPLKAGTYGITTMHHEWWSGPRTMDIKAVYTSSQGQQTAIIAEGVEVSSSNRDETVSGEITLAEDTTVELRIVKTSPNEKAVLSFVGVTLIEAGADGSVSDGDGSVSDGDGSVSDGDGSVSDGDGSVSDGDGSVSDGDGSVSDGDGSVSDGDGSVSDGDGSVSDGDDSVSGGDGSVSGGDGSVSGGDTPDDDTPDVVVPGGSSSDDDDDDDDDDDGISGELEPTVDWNALDSQVSQKLEAVNNIQAATSTVATGGQKIQNLDVVTGSNTVVPAHVVANLRQKPVTLAMHVQRGVALSITGTSVPGNNVNADLDLTLTMPTAPEAAVQSKVENAITYKQLSFANKNPLGMNINVHFGLGEENAKKNANLYIYSEAQKDYVFVGSFVITENGQAMFGLNRRGDYLVTVTEGAPRGAAVSGYTVQSGDTLSAIAYRNHMSLAELLAKNPALGNGHLIYPGQKIVVD